MRGELRDQATEYLGTPVAEWLDKRNILPDEIDGNTDLQNSRIFPVCSDVEEMGHMLQWMISDSEEKMTDKWRKCERLSANEISDRANLLRLHKQRLEFRKANLTALALNHRCSIFYQTNLEDLAHEFHNLNVPVPEALPETEPLLKRINDHMFRSRLLNLNGKDGVQEERQAFSLLAEGLTQGLLAHKQEPAMAVFSDQIVWGRSPVRIDISGGWTDTPPFSLLKGGNVVNLAIELNGQPPLQVYIKPSEQLHIVLRSIDMGAIEVVTTYEQLADYSKIGSPFSIPKAALALAGFLPAFSEVAYASLRQQLEAFGMGMEITLLSAIPAGSGLGTSSILAATVLGSLSDFCGLAWDKNEICNRTLALEQLLTTGGGWQDQYGGVLHGVKLLRTQAGFDQSATVHWLPSQLFTLPEYRACHLLYYTGITRTAKEILVEIVRGMFLNSLPHLSLLDEMKQHALEMADAIQRNDFTAYGHALAKNWSQNKQLDSGTNPPEVEAIIHQISDYCLGYKLPGAGGGGFLYIVAKDPQAAARIREILTKNPPNNRARFVEMSLSEYGFQLSRS
jgi:galactokinase/mevalonate kinase-like predicted kinase